MRGRPKVDLEPYRNWLVGAYEENSSVQTLVDVLRYSHGVDITCRTLHRRLNEWGVTIRRVVTERSLSLEERLKYLYFEFGLSDQAILDDLRRGGYQVSLDGVTRIRRDLEIWRRMTPEMVRERQRALRAFFDTDLREEGLAERLGRGNIYTHVRQRHINLSRDAVFKVYGEFHNEAIQRRLELARRRRGGWTTPGPNYIWSVDGHLKLARFGFEIYAGMDAFSRYITWFFVGFSALTARSVFAQYMYIIKQYGFIPQMMRSDRGGETTMMAAAHYVLSKRVKTRRFPLTRRHMPDMGFPEPPPMSGDDGPLPWSHCWIYGKSTQNQRIEAWWNRMQENRTLFWRQYFSMLEEIGLWDDASIADRIALLYVYMPIIRDETAQFVRLWNGHRIRHQRNRPHVIAGIPYQLYTAPDPTSDYIDCRATLDNAAWEELMQIVRLDGLDIDEYLPATTMEICAKVSQPYAHRLHEKPSFTLKTPYMPEYEKLRAGLREYMNTRRPEEPELTLGTKPVGSWTALKEKFESMGVSMDVTAYAATTPQTASHRRTDVQPLARTNDS
ncbi:hypothetical protein GGR50DRAFT_698997, partial [Xylaria sp. CBS 124048]